MKNTSHSDLERTHILNSQILCGIDEVGRGCLAGPVVVAAVTLHSLNKNSIIKDSKVLTEKQRLLAYDLIVKQGTFAISIANERLIDTLNIYKATQWAMYRAYHQLCVLLGKSPETVVVDAIPLVLPGNVISCPKAEQRSISVAAASIIAKVTRDALMNRIDLMVPGYTFSRHKGYATQEHYERLALHQASFIHRKSFLRNYHTMADMKLQGILFGE